MSRAIWHTSVVPDFGQKTLSEHSGYLPDDTQENFQCSEVATTLAKMAVSAANAACRQELEWLVAVDPGDPEPLKTLLRKGRLAMWGEVLRPIHGADVDVDLSWE